MSKTAFGDIRTFPATAKAKQIMNQLVKKKLFSEMRHVWTLGAALGLKLGKTYTQGKRGTFQNVNSLDPEGIISAIMLGLYPDLSPKQRMDQLVDYAEWGIREIARREKNGTLDLVLLAKTPFSQEKETESEEKESEYDLLDLEELIKQGESNKLEFKSSMLWDYDERRSNKTLGFEVAVTVSAFMNSEGGTLLIGVRDDETIIGLENDFKLLKKPGKLDNDQFGTRFTGIINRYLEKPNRSHVKLKIVKLDGKKIAIITVPKRAPKRVFIHPTKDEAEFYIRLGNASHRLNPEEANEYIEQHW